MVVVVVGVMVVVVRAGGAEQVNVWWFCLGLPGTAFAWRVVLLCSTLPSPLPSTVQLGVFPVAYRFPRDFSIHPIRRTVFCFPLRVFALFFFFSLFCTLFFVIVVVVLYGCWFSFDSVLFLQFSLIIFLLFLLSCHCYFLLLLLSYCFFLLFSQASCRENVRLQNKILETSRDGVSRGSRPRFSVRRNPDRHTHTHTHTHTHSETK